MYSHFGQHGVCEREFSHTSNHLRLLRPCGLRVVLQKVKSITSTIHFLSVSFALPNISTSVGNKGGRLPGCDWKRSRSCRKLLDSVSASCAESAELSNDNAFGESAMTTVWAYHTTKMTNSRTWAYRQTLVKASPYASVADLRNGRLKR